MSSHLTNEDMDVLRDWWDEETTVSVESSFPVFARIVAEHVVSARAECVELRAAVERVEALVARWEREAVERGPFDEVYTDGVAAMLRAALNSEK